MGFHLLAVMSLRHPKIILLLWAVFLAFFGSFASRLPGVLQDHGLSPTGASEQVKRILAADFHIPEEPVILVFEKRASVSPEVFRRFIERTMQQLQAAEGVSQAWSPLDGAGRMRGNYAYALLSSDIGIGDRASVLEDLRSRLPVDRDMAVGITGKAAVQADVNQASEHDMRQAEAIGIPAAFIILLLAFGGIAAAVIPVMVGLTVVAGSMGIMYMAGTQIGLSNFVLNVIPMVGLALSIDFALMLVSRFREELTSGAVVEQAMITTMKSAGRAILYSALSVFFGLLGILFIPLPIFTTVAIGAMTVLVVSALAALTLVPALLAMLWPAIQVKRSSARTIRRTPIWHAWSSFIMNRPRRSALLAFFLLGICILPAAGMKLAVPDAGSLPPDYKSRLAFDVYQAEFVSPSVSTVYIVDGEERQEQDNRNPIDAGPLTLALKTDPRVLRVDELQGEYPSLQVMLAGEPSSREVMSWLREWERRGAASASPFLLGGEAKYQQEVYDAVFDHIHQVLAFIFVSNFAVLFLAFRSVLIPLKTILMNFMSIGASFGILVWVFQGGFSGMGPGSIAIMIPVFIFGLAFGISMDYGVFLVSRIYEIHRQTGDNEYSVRWGLVATGRIITSAAAIMVAVTAPFAFGEVAGVRQLGVGIAAAVLVDATVIRLILVPSLMNWLGKWNWWAPRWLK